MKNGKKIFGFILTTIMCLSFSMVVFAASKNVEGYGTLYGRISTSNSGGYYVNTVTTVTSNPDNAFMKVKIELQDYDGSTLHKDESSSSHGETEFSQAFEVIHFDDVHRVYGSHNIQGGNRYQAQVVYTTTTNIAY